MGGGGRAAGAAHAYACAAPAAFIALDAGGEVLGGVSLHQFDLAERRDLSPWLVGTILRAERRDKGIGQLRVATQTAGCAHESARGEAWHQPVSSSCGDTSEVPQAACRRLARKRRS